MTDDHAGHPILLTTRHVMDGRLPVLRVVRDPNGDLQALDGVHAPRVADGRLTCVHHVTERDATLEPLLAELTAGSAAEREQASARWTVTTVPPAAPWRLVDLLPELAARLLAAPVDAAARYALEVAGQCVDAVGGPELVALASELHEVPVGDSPQRDALAALCQELDDAGSPRLREARAANALCALSDDPYEAASETAFEAHWCGLDDGALVAPTAAC